MLRSNGSGDRISVLGVGMLVILIVQVLGMLPTMMVLVVRISG